MLPTPFTFDLAPPMDSREKFVAWGVAQREEDAKYLGERFDRFGALVRNEDIWDDRNKHAFLLTPREKFVRPANLSRAYEHAFFRGFHLAYYSSDDASLVKTHRVLSHT